jgi:hypothetical protein
MKTIWFIALLFGLSGCSEKAPPARTPVSKSSAVRKYSVTFAAVKVSDTTLASIGLPAYDAPSTPESRRKLANYVQAHTAEFSIRAATGNILPIVLNRGQTHVTLLPDSKQEEKDFEALGMMTKEFDAGVTVLDEDEHGQVYCDWYCSCGIHLKEPLGNSTDHGMSGGCDGGMIPVGQAEMCPLLHGNGVGLWMLVALNRS